MTTINTPAAGLPDAHEKVPMMFRAQIGGRCQPQRIVDNRDTGEPQDAERWTKEWVERVYPQGPTFSDRVQTRNYDLSWRFVTNGGQDDGMIRPVIGAMGWPFYPGSSMKGLFRQACTAEQAKRYCGDEKKLDPGEMSLRFHGGYPIDDRWQENLLDIIHPQQDRQVKQEKRTSAFAQISLYKPTLKFGISSLSSLPSEEWDTIWAIWEKAMDRGLGCRVSAGYGQVTEVQGDVLCSFRLRGQGQAAKLIDGTGEFRPNVLRAAVRGHALRLFGGLTDGATAEQVVMELFGGIPREGAVVGLLAIAFGESALTVEPFGQGSYAQPAYRVEGELRWLVTRSLSAEEREALKVLVRQLTQFAMLLGGFGKSWRRVDHRLCFPEYYDQGSNPLIGCHWQWLWESPQELRRMNPVMKLEGVAPFLEEVRQSARAWMALRGVRPNPSRSAEWREAWHPGRVQVWGRVAEEMEDCEAVRWLHGPYQRADRVIRRPELSIYQSSVTGQMGQMGRLRHRMYPWLRVVKDPKNDDQPKVINTRKFLELLTLFPDGSEEMDDFLVFLSGSPGGFVRLWGGR